MSAPVIWIDDRVELEGTLARRGRHFDATRINGVTMTGGVRVQGCSWWASLVLERSVRIGADVSVRDVHRLELAGGVETRRDPIAFLDMAQAIVDDRITSLLGMYGGAP